MVPRGLMVNNIIFNKYVEYKNVNLSNNSKYLLYTLPKSILITVFHKIKSYKNKSAN